MPQKMRPSTRIVLTEDGEFERVHFGLPERLVGCVAGERDIPVDGWHGEGQLTIGVPAARACRLIPGRGLRSRLSVHYPRDLRWRVTVLGEASEGDVVADTCLMRTSYSHLLWGDCKERKR